MPCSSLLHDVSIKTDAAVIQKNAAVDFCRIYVAGGTRQYGANSEFLVHWDTGVFGEMVERAARNNAKGNATTRDNRSNGADCPIATSRDNQASTGFEGAPRGITNAITSIACHKFVFRSGFRASRGYAPLKIAMPR